MKVVVTGARGFVGENVAVRLSELKSLEPLLLTRQSSCLDVENAVSAADAVIHLAGVNRPRSEAEFISGNVGPTEVLCRALVRLGRRIPIIYASSVKASEDSPYGRSKLAAEELLLEHSKRNQAPVVVFRLPNIFGKWARPNYNSAVATFCYNTVHDLPISIHDPSAPISLVYVDDVVDRFLQLLAKPPKSCEYGEINPIYTTNVGALANAIQGFKEKRTRHRVDDVGTGFLRALYATYISYLEPENFCYGLETHEDNRGVFAEFIKTEHAGQFSIFSAKPGVTRGGHYHHTKTEKFLVVRGQALFRFRHILTGATHEIHTSAESPTVVETVPGWAHDVTNVGTELLLCLLWANEVFDKERPDTIARRTRNVDGAA